MTLNSNESELLAVLFASGDPIEYKKLEEAFGCTHIELLEAIHTLAEKLIDMNFPLTITQLGESFQLVTKEEYAPVIKNALQYKRNSPLSPAAMEVLAIIAYNAPVTRSFIEQVRGTDSSSVVSLLVERGLVEECGRLDLPGKPLAFRTTDNFLRCFGLKSLDDLPKITCTEEETVSAEENS